MTRGEPAGRAGRVALTFDTEHPDRPARPGGDGELVALARDLGIRATFFIQGRWAEAHPALARRIVDAGHVVGSHSHYHVRMPLLTVAGMRADLRTAEAAIREATGRDPRPWFRLPFGAGMDDARVLAAVDAAGYRHCGWDVAADDWDPVRSANDIAGAVVDGVLARDGDAVVLLHSWPDQTATALPAIVDRLRAGGRQLVGLDELDAVPAGGPSVDPMDVARRGPARP